MKWTEVYRDRDILAISKPAGLPTQSTKTGESGLFEALQAQESYVGLHHRLDRPASGLVLFSLDRRANKGLASGFQRHTIRRTYTAVVVGSVSDCTWSWSVGGKSAKTHVTVVGEAAGFTAVRMSLDTGRKHQIRVHAAMAGAPIAGDRRYGAEAGYAWPRLALHASQLTLKHPVTGEVLVLEAPLPEGLVALWQIATGGS